MVINVSKLDWELVEAGIPIYGCASDGRIDFKPEATTAQKQLAEQIKINHNPIWYREERLKRYPPTGDQLDYLYKIFKQLKADGINIGIDGNQWLAVIDKIKSDFPKT